MRGGRPLRHDCAIDINYIFRTIAIQPASKACGWANILITKDGGPGRMSAAAFDKKIRHGYDWDTHEVTPADSRS